MSRKKKIDTENGPGITCKKHGIYGMEWPYYEACPYCAEVAALTAERDKLQARVAELEARALCLQAGYAEGAEAALQWAFDDIARVRVNGASVLRESAKTDWLQRGIRAVCGVQCGFYDVRKDDDGYFCRVCGKRMSSDFEEKVKASLPASRLKQLQEQCTK